MGGLVGAISCPHTPTNGVLLNPIPIHNHHIIASNRILKGLFCCIILSRGMKRDVLAGAAAPAESYAVGNGRDRSLFPE